MKTISKLAQESGRITASPLAMLIAFALFILIISAVSAMTH